MDPPDDIESSPVFSSEDDPTDDQLESDKEKEDDDDMDPLKVETVKENSGNESDKNSSNGDESSEKEKKESKGDKSSEKEKNKESDNDDSASGSNEESNNEGDEESDEDYENDDEELNPDAERVSSSEDESKKLELDESSSSDDDDESPSQAKERLKHGAFDNFMKNKDDERTAAHRKAFMNMAYNVKKGGVIKAVNKSKRFNDKRYRDLLTFIKNWNSKKKRVRIGNKTMKLTEFKSMHKVGYVAINKYEVEGLTLSDGTKVRQLYRLPSKKDKEGGIVVPMSRVFDAIKSAHIRNKHMKVLATYKKLRQVFWNITEQEVKCFIVTCPVCNSAPPKARIIKGTKTPIRSNKFGDRVQVDLIDMRRYRRKDEAGHMMKYIVTAKDHFSGFVMLDAISEKTPAKVAHVLQRMFGTIGYPRILHTDNGREFTGRVLLEALYQRCPGMLTVTGRPRTPRDQGSVENMNQHVKKAIRFQEEQFRHDFKNEGERPNWTNLLGSVQIELNAKEQKESYGVSSFETVFGFKHKDHEGFESFEEMRKCKTVRERLAASSRHSEFYKMMHSNKEWKYVDTTKYPEEVGEIWPDTDLISEDEDMMAESNIDLSSSPVLNEKSSNADDIQVLSPAKEARDSIKRK